MALKLNRPGVEQAESLARAGLVVIDDRDASGEHQPSGADEPFIDAHGWTEYGRWHLGIDDDEEPETKAHNTFPYGDFEKVHRCAILAAESRAGQYHYDDIESVAHHLHGMLEGVAAR